MNDGDVRAAELEAAARDLVFREAELLDAGRWEDWLALLHPEMRYWVPLDPDAEAPEDGPSLFDDDRVVLDMRCRRFRHARAFGRETGRTTLHQVGALRSRIEGGRAVVSSHLVVHEFAHDRLTLFPGRQVHEIVEAESGPLILSKTVRLITMTGVFDPIEIIL